MLTINLFVPQHAASPWTPGSRPTLCNVLSLWDDALGGAKVDVKEGGDLTALNRMVTSVRESSRSYMLLKACGV